MCTTWNDWQMFIAALEKKVPVSLRETSAHHAERAHVDRSLRDRQRVSERLAHVDFLTASERDGYFALPTEAQWEYACRAGSTTEYCFGDDPARLKDYAWVCADDAPQPRDRQWPDLAAGDRKPNNWGLHDMHGSVREWCADWWDEDYYSRSPLVDPPGPPTGNFKVLRGGAVKSYGRFARSAFRLFLLPDIQDAAVDNLSGARLVVNLR
jgi:formylglycine-generating enzyme required for sulfatase activity